MFQHINIYNNPSKLINSGVIEGVHFYVTGSTENKDLGYVNIFNKELFKGVEPVIGGANDLRLGTTEELFNCETCFNNKLKCPGHLGYIELRYPVKNPYFRDKLLKWLKVCCFNCGRPVTKKKIIAPKNQILGEYVKECRNISKCERCGENHPRVVKDKYKSLQFYKVYGDDERERKEIFYNNQILNAINRIPDEVVIDMGKPLCSHPKKFILTTIIVSPTTARPDIRKVGGGRSNNNDTTTFLKNIISINTKLPTQIPDLKHIDPESREISRELESITRNYYNLDQHVYDMIRGSSSSTVQFKVVSSNNKTLMSLAQRFPQKDGIFRKNINGRRVFNASRSVITGDPMMPIDVVGIPLHVATTIHIPEIVQPFNRERLHAIYMNRRDTYPGWSSLIKAIDGKKYGVSRFPKDYRLQEGDILYRDVMDGDIVGFGRQPSLLPSNISGFKVKVLMTESTFRMNVSACNLFNADGTYQLNVCVCNLFKPSLSATVAGGYKFGINSRSVETMLAASPILCH